MHTLDRLNKDKNLSLMTPKSTQWVYHSSIETLKFDFRITQMFLLKIMPYNYPNGDFLSPIT